MSSSTTLRSVLLAALSMASAASAGFPTNAANAAGDKLGTAPTGLEYVRNPKARDSEVVFTDLALGPLAVLNKFTQYQDGRTKFDDDRCAPTAVLAMCLAQGGAPGCQGAKCSAAPKACLGKIVDRVAKGAVGDEKTELAAIQARIKAGTATYGDLGRVAQLALSVYPSAGEDGSVDPDHPGMSGADLFNNLLEPSGATRPKLVGRELVLPRGSSWPIQVAVGQSGVMNHWLLKGQTADGRDFIYDPLPVGNGPQVYIKNGEGANAAGYSAYLDHIKQQCDGCGFAPIKKVPVPQFL